MTSLIAIGPDELVRASQDSGSWQRAGVWLASTLNRLDAACRRGDIARAERAGLLDDHVNACRGELRDIDVIVFPDGTRVCWHPAATIRGTRWIVERRGERCAFGG
jgi:hypothetical protein